LDSLLIIMILDFEDTFIVGQDIYFDSISPTTSFGVTFEDDLTTGYLYAINTQPGLQILDAVHIYNVVNVIDKLQPSKFQIWWTDDGQIAALLINNYCHAIFDFVKEEGFCRTAFPPPNGKWARDGERNELTDDLVESLKDR